jgi:hypothetical protein
LKTLLISSVSLIITSTFVYLSLKNISFPDKVPKRIKTVETPSSQQEIKTTIKFKKIKFKKNNRYQKEKRIKRGKGLTRNSIVVTKIRQQNRVSKFRKQKKSISNMIDSIEKEKLHE